MYALAWLPDTEVFVVVPPKMREQAVWQSEMSYTAQ